MKITVMDYACGKVIVYSVARAKDYAWPDDAITSEDAEEFITQKGHRLEDCHYMVSEENPINTHPGRIMNTKANRFEEGDDYWTIEGDEVVHSCWDDLSEEYYDPKGQYFATESDAMKELCRILKDKIKNCNDQQIVHVEIGYPMKLGSGTKHMQTLFYGYDDTIDYEMLDELAEATGRIITTSQDHDYLGDAEVRDELNLRDTAWLRETLKRLHKLPNELRILKNKNRMKLLEAKLPNSQDHVAIYYQGEVSNVLFWENGGESCGAPECQIVTKEEI